ncbi:MAG: NADH-quinone oxidoreductase subunit M [Pirellulales bacterium]|nr:NADH-quinone oxidoreductase subunit M [Pirellulales bacterium]
MPSLLVLALLVPLAGAFWVAGPRGYARAVALGAALATLAVACALVAQFPAGEDAEVAVFDAAWLGGEHGPVDVRLSVGLDGLSLWLFGLTALLSVVAVLVGWDAIDQQAPLYYRLLLLLETGMLGVFAARDIILFYIFFEFTLIPLFSLIGIWGSQQRRLAAVKFFLFTLVGSVLSFLGLLAIVLWDHQHAGTGAMTFSIAALTERLAAAPMPPHVQLWVFLALFAGLAVKVPMVPLHTWLPLAHVEAPAAGSVLLAGVLLKIGAYGFLRFAVPMLPAAVVTCMPWLLSLSVAGILYGALVALAQSDMKRLVAYSSVSHMGFCTLGLFALNPLGTQGAVVQMIHHGLATGGLFALVGMLHERYHTRSIAELGGLARRLPWAAFFMLVMTLSSIGLPGLGGFVGEFLILLGMFDRGWAAAPGPWIVLYRILAVLAVAGVVLGAWYMLWLVERVFFGLLREPRGRAAAPPRDLNVREIACLAPLAVVTLWLGLAPRFFLDRMSPTLDRLTVEARQTLHDRTAPMVTSPRALREGEAPAEPIGQGFCGADSWSRPRESIGASPRDFRGICPVSNGTCGWFLGADILKAPGETESGSAGTQPDEGYPGSGAPMARQAPDGVRHQGPFS